VIAEFEQRLADVLGGLMPAPFGGRVQVAPGTLAADEPAVLVGVTRTERLPDELGGNRPAVAPGADEPRRVVRLRCTVTLEVLAAQNAGRAQRLDGLDAALYALDDPGFRRGTPLAGGAADPGFLVHELAVVEGQAPFDEDDPLGPAALKLRAEGLFWPPGVGGQAGDRVGEIRLRGIVLPLEVSLPLDADLVAGGPAVTLTVRIGAAGPPPFGPLALSLRGPAGQAGAGTLQGGTAGSDGTRLVELEAGAAEVVYVPPGAAARDQLIVALDDGEGGPGIELGQRVLEVRAP
jgi:hypothetical protein